MKRLVLLITLATNSYFLFLNASDGTLDPSFGGGTGFVTNSNGSEYVAAAVQTDGKIVAVMAGAFSVSTLYLVRLNADGSIDNSFSGGTVLMPIDGADLVIQADGKIVIAGISGIGGVGALVRYNSDGSPDTDFGIVQLPTSSGFLALLVQADSKIVATGHDLNGKLLVARFMPDGGLDTIFTATGLAQNFTDLVIQSDGKIVVLNSFFHGATQLVRYNNDGTLDNGFGSNGIAVGPVGNASHTLAIQSDGKLVIGGLASTVNFQVSRFDTSGNPDLSFNGTGTNTVVAGANPLGMALQADGKIVLVGWNSTGPIFQLARYNTDGTLDTASFGSSGIAMGPAGMVQGFAALQADGNIIAVGNNASSQAVMARYLSSPALVTTQISAPAAGSTVSLGTVAFTGQAQDPSMVYVLVNGVVQGGVHTDPNNWTVPITINALGAYTVQAVSVYQDGNLNIASAPITLNVRLQPPTNFTGTIIQNEFLNKTECILQATFVPSSSTAVIAYRIEKNGVLLALIPADQPSIGTINGTFITNSVNTVNTNNAPYTFTYCSDCKKNPFAGITVSAVTANGVVSNPVPLAIVHNHSRH